MKRSPRSVLWTAVLLLAPLGGYAAPEGKKPAARKTGTEAPLKNPPAAKTVITGDRMNIVERGEAVEFTGGVKLVRGGDTLSAERMVSREKEGLTRAWGRVHMTRRSPEEGLMWEAWADQAAYDADASSGTLWGGKAPARVRRTPLEGESGTLELEAERITLFQSAAPGAPKASTRTYTFTDAAGRVYLFYREAPPQPRETRVWAGRLRFDGAAGSARFTEGHGRPRTEAARFPEHGVSLDRPRALQKEDGEVRDLTGGSITYFLEDQRLSAEGDVQAVIRSGNAEFGGRNKGGVEKP